MTTPGLDHPGPALLARETRLREGAVGLDLGAGPLEPGQYCLHREEFLLRTESGLRFHYRKGDGVTVQRPQRWDPAEESLCLNGSVYAAAACINGFFPVHASAVASHGQVFAFTGPSGAGKSTLVAELARRGWPLFCDDTLILDLSDPSRILCLPGHKRLKLWPDALAMTGAAAGEAVIADQPKVYAEPAGGVVAAVLPLAELCFLEAGTPARIDVIRGAEKLTRLQDDHYTTDLFLAANRPKRAERFEQLAALAKAVRQTRFVRPFDRESFSRNASVLSAYMTSGEW